MKKGVLILLGMLILVTTINAKENKRLTNRFEINYSYNNAVNFFEKGIEFFVFTNGDFDYNLNRNKRQNRIEKDFRGRINRISNVTLSYDYRGNITRIGNISIRYYRNRISKIGDLKVSYNRFGEPIFIGNVRDYYYNDGIRFSFNFGDICSYNNEYFYNNSFKRNYTKFREDINFYYYRANKNAKIGKRSTILKRRKQVSTLRNQSIKVKNYNNSYYRKNHIQQRKPYNRNISNSNISTKTNNRNTNIKKRQNKRSDKIKSKGKNFY